MGELNIVDIVILTIFFFSIFMGFVRGFVNEIVSLLTTVAAFVLATMFASPLAQFFTSNATVQSVVSSTTSAIGVNTAQPINYAAFGLAFGLIFIFIVIVGSCVKSLLTVAFTTGILGVGNRILGAAFGFVRGFIFNLVLIFLFQLSPWSQYAWYQQSQYVASFQPAVQWLGTLVSPALNDIKSRFGHTLDETLQDVNQGISKVTNQL